MAGTKFENQSHVAPVIGKLLDPEFLNISQKLIMSNDSFVNKSENSTITPELPLDMKFNDGHLMAIVMYFCLMFISATGNVYVFCSLMRLRKHGKLGRINLLLLNLATADLIVTFVMMPLEISWNATVSWLAGDFLCRILSFFRVFGLYLSAFVVICICLDRYFAIIKPLAFGKAQNRVKKLLMGAWISSIFSSLPQAFIFHVERHPEFQWYEQCITFNSFPSPEYELAYNLFGFCIMYALPMTTIIYCYSCILWQMYAITAERRNEIRLRRSTEVLIERAKAKTLKMTLITAIAFSVCWTPYNIISLWYWFDKSSAMELDQRLQKAFFVFACTNSCVNPLIYGWYHVGTSQRRLTELIANPPHHLPPQHLVCECRHNYMFPPQQQPIEEPRHLSEEHVESNEMKIIENPCTIPSPSNQIKSSKLSDRTRCCEYRRSKEMRTIECDGRAQSQRLAFSHTISTRKYLLAPS